MRTICPNRFKEGLIIYRWVGEELLSNPDAVVLDQIGFLSRLSDEVAENSVDLTEDVGKIDNVLVSVIDSDVLHWCALEIQAVYMSGSDTTSEIRGIAEYTATTLPVPGRLGRPDYRSSGPKRLMPQLQIKVPSLRRWGKKMAVVVDQDFFEGLGHMDAVRHVSNCDIAWFVVGYAEDNGVAHLEPRRVVFTTLERAVEGLTAGLPVDMPEFERRIRAKLAEVQGRQRDGRRVQ